MKSFVTAFGLFAGTFLLYLPLRGNGFVDYDDGSYITKNPEVLAGLTRDGVRWAFAEFHSANWHPLTWLSHMLDVELFGLDAGRHHLVNAGLHALNAALLFLFLAAATRGFWPSVAVAALFAAHPLRVESVAWASERKDVLSGAFFFAALLAYTSYVKRPGLPRYALVAGLFGLGLLAKPMLVTFPLLLLLLDAWPFGRFQRERWQRLALEKAPLFLLALASSLVTVAAQRAGEALRTFEALPLATRVANAFLAYAAYVAKSAWPRDLAIFYPHPGLVFDDYTPWSLPGSAAALGIASVSALALFQTRRWPWFFVGWFWYLILALPVIGILQVGAQWIADRYAYLPTIGLYVAVAFGIARRFPTPRGQALLGLTGLVLAALLACGTLKQLAYWKDTRTLFEHALAVTERNYVAHMNLGFLEHHEGHLEAAETHYLAALEIAPRLADAHSNLGGLCYSRDEYAEARMHLERALEIDPSFTKARLNLGLVQRELGDREGALSEFRTALAREPDSLEAAATLAAELALADRSREARDVLSSALRRRPNAFASLRELLGASGWKALRALATALADRGDFERAAGVALEAAARAPAEEQAGLLELQRRLRARERVSE